MSGNCCCVSLGVDFSVKRTYRSGSDLLQGVLTLGVAGVAHDDHDDGHVFVYERQRAVLQFSSQDALRVHVGDLLNFLQFSKQPFSTLG